ncbi:HAMP domain-containing protein [candidate division KSB1 bacterium]|nr:HAMP domain-containing protein [candidate division KSB1 bacterium]
MKTLRGKILLYVSLLLILPSLPLSYFVLQLLDKSYAIGVNERVRLALAGGLNISADLYQMHKSLLQMVIDDIQSTDYPSSTEIAQKIKTTLSGAKAEFLSPTELNSAQSLIPADVSRQFATQKNASYLWHGPDHKTLYAIATLGHGQLLYITYPLPQSFQQSASQIQEVNQIYKTLGFAQKELRTSFLYAFLSIYSIFIIIMLLVLIQISKKISRPIGQLVGATREIGKGNLGYRIHPKGKDEFAILAAAFDQMVEELASNQKKIIELEKMATWQQLARRLAHEIKNPLTPIQLMAQQMRDAYHEHDPEYQKLLNECYEMIDDEVESLKKLVREFSDFARLPEFQIMKQALNPLIKGLQTLYQGNRLEIDLPETDVEIEFDNDYLKRALINLVDNAIAASEPEAPVLIEVRDKEEIVEIAVTDRGHGIAPDYLEKIFEPYFSSKRTGVGLGLPIVKKIIEEHKGEITVTSAVGAGTTFTVNLKRVIS